MNVNQNKNYEEQEAKLNLALIHLEKAKPLSVWQRVKMAFTSSDLDLQSWQQLESKRNMKSGSPKQWRNN